MKNQYVGDIGDYGKYGLLRFLASNGIKIGVNWYLTEDDGSTDGKFVNYLTEGKGKDRDPELFEALRNITSCNEKTIRMCEELIPNAVYYREKVPVHKDPEAQRINRRLWFNNSTLFLREAELVFADPDNGMLSEKKTAGNKGAEKYILPEEAKLYYESGRDVVYYCHKGRRKQAAWEETKTQMKMVLPDSQLLVLTYHRGTQRSYIFVIHPDHYSEYEKLLFEFRQTKWKDDFTRETVNDKTLREGIAEAILEVMLSDGSTLQMSVDTEGNFFYTSSREPTRKYTITPDKLSQLLLQ